MAYGDDITEGLPYALSNPNAARTFALTGEAYDLSVNGQPFYVFATDETPYRRQTAQYRKDQVDQTREPGEQTLTGWWLRSQSSFHAGDGINFYDPAAGETVEYRFADSKGVNVWEKGNISLLKSVTSGHAVTGTIASNKTSQQHVRSIQWSGNDGILLRDEYDVDKINTAGTVTHFIDYNSGTDAPVYAICDDGVNAYWITNTSTKKTVYKKPLTGTSASTADVTTMFDEIGTISNATMEYVKNRIVMAADNKVYEFAGNASAMPTAVYTNPITSHVYTSVTASGPAIYLSGYNGIQSTIEKYTLASNGSMPTLASSVVAAELPVGEIAHKIFYYLGRMLIGTNKGIRAALVNDADGSITYGPLIVETSQAIYDFAARDKFVWCAAGVDGEPGLIRLDLDNEISTLQFAWANDVYFPGITGHPTTACAFMGNTSRIAFTTAKVSTVDGAVYSESASTLVSSGYITTGKIRYSTLEGKVFKLLTPRVDVDKGGIDIESVSPSGNVYTIGQFAEDSLVSEVSIGYPIGAQEYLSFKFTLNRSTINTANGPTLQGYQIKALPAIPRQRLIQYPLACYDIEKDKFNISKGYEGSAYDRMIALETIENQGDSIRVDDFRTGESYVGLIEEIQFINRTPPDKRFSGFGGILYVTVRSL